MSLQRASVKVRDFWVLRCILILFDARYTKRDAPGGRAVSEAVKKSKDAQKRKIASRESLAARELKAAKC